MMYDLMLRRRTHMTKLISPRSKITIAMLIWGTIGLFVREIHLDSITVAFFRAAIGSVFLLAIDRKSVV